MDFQAAALLAERGVSPQDYAQLAEEYDLLAVNTAILHDPESSAETPEHLAEILQGPVVWLPGAVPYGRLWRDTRAGLPPANIKLCPSCFPPREP